MKLFYSPTSPYVRKVMAAAKTVGVDRLITVIQANPHASPADLTAMNPLSKVPCLVTEDGLSLYDSPLICEYLDSIGSHTLYPTGATRWRTLKFEALGDGLLDAAILRRMEQGRQADPDRTAVIERQAQVMERALDTLEGDPPADHLDIGSITIACALGYLDLRFAGDKWRQHRPKLAAWFEKMSARPEIASTAPPAG